MTKEEKGIEVVDHGGPTKFIGRITGSTRVPIFPATADYQRRPPLNHVTNPTIAPPKAWHATFVQRWHAGDSSPWLARSGDCIGWHGARMAVLARTFWPDASGDLIWACVAHDLGEFGSGDIPFSSGIDPWLRDQFGKVEARTALAMGMATPVDHIDIRRLKFLDRLDAYLWAQHNAPALMYRQDWKDQGGWLWNEARELGVDMTAPAAQKVDV